MAMLSPAQPKRILTLDMLRGVCLVEMMANHLPRNLLTRAAVETAGFVSAAEGFIFISGFVAGRGAARALAANKPVRFVARRMLFRAAQIYVAYAVLLTIVLASVKLGGLRFSEWEKLCQIGTTSVEQIWLYGVVLLHQPAYLDIFSVYCTFLLLVPLIIWQIRAGRWWLVMTISVGIWAVSQFWNNPQLPPVFQLGYFNLFSWQLLFMFGVRLGYGTDKWCGTPSQSRWGFLLCGVFCLALFALRQSPRLGVFPAVNTFNLADKSTLGAIRLLNFAALAYIVRVVLQRLGPGIERHWMYQKLAFLGQHSLQVFSWSVGITYVAYLSAESWWQLPVGVQTCFVGAAIVSLWIPAWLHTIWKSWYLRIPATEAPCCLNTVSR